MSFGENLIFTARNLLFSYQQGEKPVLNNVSFKIESGKTMAIIGENGSGKSTLLRLILGILKPSNGLLDIQNHLSGEKVNIDNLRISYVPQFERIPKEFLVEDYILMGRTPFIALFAQPEPEDHSIVDQIISDLDLQHFRGKQIGAISGGELQRVRIARALAQEPSIIVLDEPATFLDLSKKKMVFSLLMHLAKSGKIIIFSTNDPNDALIFSDHTLFINNSAKSIFGNSKEVITPKIIAEYFHVDSQMITVNNQNVVIYL